MRAFNALCGGQTVLVQAPGVGEFDPFYDHVESVGLWGLDVETNGTDPFADGFIVRTVQLGDESSVFVLRMDDPEQRSFAISILADRRNTFASHTKIDVHAVWTELGVDIADRSIDTHVLAVMSAPDDVAGQAALKDTAARFGMPELAEGEKALNARFEELYRQAHPEVGKRKIKAATIKQWGFSNIDLADPLFVRYAGLDAIAATRLVHLLATASKAPSHVLTTERWLSEQAIRLERRGHLVDVQRLEQVAGQARAIETQSENVIGLLVDQRPKTKGVVKPTQTAWLVDYFEKHGAVWGDHPRTDKGAISLAKDSVYRLRTYDLDEDAKQVAEAYIEHTKVIDKLKRTTEIRAGMDAAGYVHPTLYTVGTVTSRMSSGGPNMQNFSKKDPVMRGLFTFDEGYVGISCDFAQIELRVVAALAKEKVMIDTILAGGDLHQLTADRLKIDRSPTAKRTNFLIVYGGGGGQLSKKLLEDGKYIPEDECRAIVKEFWKQYPAIAALNEYMKTQNGLRLVSGRYVPTGTTKDGGSRSYANLNYLIQGSARELLVGAWRRFQEGVEAKGWDAHVWFPIHDELVIQVREEQAQEVADWASRAMSFDFYGVPISAEADLLIDEHGTSRWMPGDVARAIQEAKK